MNTNVVKRTNAEIEADFKRIKAAIEEDENMTSYLKVARKLGLTKCKVMKSLEGHSVLVKRFNELFERRLNPSAKNLIPFMPAASEDAEVIQIYDVSGLMNTEKFEDEKIYIASEVYNTLEAISLKNPYDGQNAAMLLNLIDSRPQQFIVLKAPKVKYKTTPENIGRSNYATFSLAVSFAEQGKKVFVSTSSSKLKSLIRLNGLKRISWKSVLPTGRYTKAEMTS